MALGTSWTQIASQGFTYLGYSGTAYVYAKLNRQDIANNKSYIDLELRIYHSAWVQSYDTDFYLTGNGWIGEAYRSFDAGTTTITSSQISVVHNDDGTRTFTASGGYQYGGIGVSATTFTSSAVALPTIARASAPTASPNPLTVGSSGATLTVTTNRKASSFMHTVKVQCGSWSWTSTARSVGASVNVTIPYTVIAQFSATSKTATATVTCTTFSGTTQIGSAQTCSVTFQINTSDDHPNVGTITISDTNATTSAVVQDNTKYVAYKSTLSASIPLTVSGSYTQLASATVTCGTKTQTYTLSGTSQTITFTFANVNANKLTVTVKDKRGTSASGSKTWTLLSYSPLTMTATVGRTTATGTTATGKVTGNAYGGTFGASTNSLTISYQYKLHTASSWTSGANSYTQSISSGVQSYTKNITFSEAFDYTNQYDIKFTVKDLFTTVTYTCQLMQGLPVLSWDESEVDVYGNFHVHYRATPEFNWYIPNTFDAQFQSDGQKNLLPRVGKTQTINGITFTVSSANGKVTANGTATATASYKSSFKWTHTTQNLYFSGCASGGSESTYDVYMWDVDANARPKKWDETTAITGCYGNAITDSQEVRLENGKTYQYIIRIRQGVTVSGVVFSPMLRNWRFPSNYYEAYAPTNREYYTPTEIRNVYFTDLAGFTILQGNIYKLGRLIIGNIVLDYGSSSLPASSKTLTVAEGYRPINIVNHACWVTNNQYTGAIVLAYNYINNTGSFTICPVSSGYRYVKIDICYIGEL